MCRYHAQFSTVISDIDMISVVFIRGKLLKLHASMSIHTTGISAARLIATGVLLLLLLLLLSLSLLLLPLPPLLLLILLLPLLLPLLLLLLLLLFLLSLSSNLLGLVEVQATEMGSGQLDGQVGDASRTVMHGWCHTHAAGF